MCMRTSLYSLLLIHFSFPDVLMRCLGESRRSRPSVLSGQPLNPYELFILRARFTDTEAAVLAGFGESCCFLVSFLLCV